MPLIPKSKKFILRRIRKSDRDSWCENIIEKNKSVNFTSAPSDITDARKRFSLRFKNGKKKFGLPGVQLSDRFVIDVGGAAAGEINVHILSKHHKAYFSYWVGKNYRGNGIATDAVKLLLPYAFKKHKLVRIEAFIRPDNPASARVVEKAGFNLEGLLRKNRVRDGKFIDDLVYAKIK